MEGELFAHFVSGDHVHCVAVSPEQMNSKAAAQDSCVEGRWLQVLVIAPCLFKVDG